MKHKIFYPQNIAHIFLKNRIIRSATHEGLAEDNGAPTETLKNKYVQLAKGGVGAIITGYAGIQQNGKSPFKDMLMIDRDNLIPEYTKIVKAVHEYQTPIILQIAHCGRQTRSKITGQIPVAPSAIKDKFYNEEVPEELRQEDIQKIISNFVHAIERAKKAGFDGVQLHGAHGYLLSEFLSPYMNHRKDQWGGNTANRFRIISEIFKNAKNVVGDYPIFIKINSHDGRKNGMNVQEAIKISKLLEQVGCAAIEVSCGIFEDGFYTARGTHLPMDAVFKFNYKYKKIPNWQKPIIKSMLNIFIPKIKPLEKYNVSAAKQIKKQVSLPIIVVGGIHSMDHIVEILEKDKLDFVSMSRPFIVEPNLVKKFQEGVQTRSKCIYCNYCLLGIEEKPFRCYMGKMTN